MSDTASDQSFEIAARYETDDAARQAVESLTVRGVGATWEERATTDGSSTANYAVLVVPGDASRAREILGVGTVSEDTATTASSPADARRRQLFWVLVVFGIAMIVVPAIAFYVTFKLSGG
jgi:hypothetical protein